MAKYVKWVGGALGWAMGGPLGAILGFALGSVFDTAEIQVHDPNQKFQRKTTSKGDFSASLLVLSAAVMKADGRVLKSELDYVKQFYIRQFGASQTEEQMLLFKELLKQDIPVKEVCLQIKHYMHYPVRLQLLHYLFGISASDGKVHQQEVNTIIEISNYLGISLKDLESIKAMFFRNTESDYKILEIETTATDEEVKKAYRKMALKYHPDKVTQLGEEFQKAAHEKFQEVQRAYENIKKERKVAA